MLADGGPDADERRVEGHREIGAARGANKRDLIRLAVLQDQRVAREQIIRRGDLPLFKRNGFCLISDIASACNRADRDFIERRALLFEEQRAVVSASLPGGRTHTGRMSAS